MKHNEETNKFNLLIFNLEHIHKNVDTMHQDTQSAAQTPSLGWLPPKPEKYS